MCCSDSSPCRGKTKTASVLKHQQVFSTETIQPFIHDTVTLITSSFLDVAPSDVSLSLSLCVCLSVSLSECHFASTWITWFVFFFYRLSVSSLASVISFYRYHAVLLGPAGSWFDLPFPSPHSLFHLSLLVLSHVLYSLCVFALWSLFQF